MKLTGDSVRIAAGEVNPLTQMPEEPDPAYAKFILGAERSRPGAAAFRASSYARMVLQKPWPEAEAMMWRVATFHPAVEEFVDKYFIWAWEGMAEGKWPATRIMDKWLAIEYNWSRLEKGLLDAIEERTHGPKE